MDKESLRMRLEQDLGISPSEGDLRVLLAELDAVRTSLESWQRLELRDVEPWFLVRDRVPSKGKTP